MVKKVGHAGVFGHAAAVLPVGLTSVPQTGSSSLSMVGRRAGRSGWVVLGAGAFMISSDQAHWSEKAPVLMNCSDDGCLVAAEMFGVVGMKVLAAHHEGGELRLLVQTPERVGGCRSCGVVALAHGRRDHVLRDADLPCVFRTA